MSLLTHRRLLKVIGIIAILSFSVGSSAKQTRFDTSDSFLNEMNQSPEMLKLLGPLEGKLSSMWLSNTPYKSHLEASAAASNRFNPLSIIEDREYLGTILKSEGNEPHYLYLVNHGQANADVVPIRIVVPVGYELAAFWHTHGAEHWSRVYFSSQDTALAKRWGVPVYLANHTGNLQVFNPEQETRSSAWAKWRGLGAIEGVAKGQRIRGNRIATRE